MENNLENIIKVIKDRREILATEKKIHEIVDPFTQRTKLGKIRRAKEDLKNCILNIALNLNNVQPSFLLLVVKKIVMLLWLSLVSDVSILMQILFI